MKKRILNVLLVALMSVPGFLFAQPLTGSKTVGGTTPDYATLSLAIDALNTNGAGTGGVIFLVAAGHTETMLNKTITTTTGSATNPIVFMKNGSGANPLITAGVGTSTTVDAVIKIVGVDYLTIDGIDLVDPATNTSNSTRMEWGYAILKSSATNGCQNVTIRNCVVTLQKANTASKGIYGGNHIATSTTQLVVSAASGIHKSIDIYNNNVSNAYSGIHFSGYNNVLYYDDSIRIGSLGQNIVTNFGGTSTACFGIYLANFRYAEVMNDSISGGASTSSDVSGINTAAATGATIIIENNSVQTQASSSISNIYGIYSASGANGGSIIIRGNRVQNGVMSGSISQFYYIYTNSTASTEIYDNLISGGAITTSQGSGHGIYVAGFPEVRNIYNNTLTATSYTVSIGTYYGINVSAGIANVFNNTISSNTSNNHFYAIYSTGSAKIYRNFITNNTVTGSSAQHYGIFCTGALPNQIYENTVGPYSTTGSGVLQGIILAGTAEYRVFRNKVFGLNSSHNSTAVSGIVQSAASTAHIYNNLVGQLTTGASASAANGINGINITSTADGTVSNITHNNIYISATSTGGSNCLLLSATSLASVNNNLFVNLSSNGTTVARSACALRRTTTNYNTYLITSNNNFFYVAPAAVANRFIYYDGSASFQTLPLYQVYAQNRDQSSITGTLTFQSTAGISPLFLKPDTTIPCLLESSGRPLTGIHDDYLVDNSRSAYPLSSQVNGGGTGPDIGAWELDMIPADSTGPEINFVPLTKSLVTSYKNLDNVTITDPRGVNMSSGHVPRLYYKKSVNSNSLAASNSSSSDGWKYVESGSFGSPYSFTMDFSLLYPSGSIAAGDIIQYFVVAEDDAALHNTRMKGATPNAAASSVALVSGNFPVSTGLSFPIVTSGMSSSVTVGASGATYSSFTLPGGLFDAINNSLITNDVLVQVTSDLTGETGAIGLNKYAEDGFGIGTYRILVQPSSPTSFTISGTSTATGLFRFTDVSRFVMDGSYSGTGNHLSFVNKVKSGNNAVFHFISSGFGGGCKNITLRNCNIWTDTTRAAGVMGIFVGGSVVGTGGLVTNNAGVDHYGISLQNNAVSGAYNGILINGHITNPADSIFVLNNILGSDTLEKYLGNTGIYLNRVNRIQVKGNQIFNVINSGTNPLYGIYLGNDTRNAELNGNSIRDIVNSNTASVAVHGIYLAGTNNSHIQLKNNLIGRVLGQGAASSIATGPTGIYIASGSNYKILNNTVSLNGTRLDITAGSAYTSCLYAAASVSGLDVQNNVFKNVMTSNNVTNAGSNFALFSDAPPAAYTRLNFNLYYVASGTASVVKALAYQGAVRTDLAAWRTYSGLDKNSLWGNPGYDSDSSLTPNLNDTNNWLLNGRGYPNTEVETDYSGNARSTTLLSGATDIGAYELTPAVPPMSATASALPLAGNTTYYSVGNDTIAAIIWETGYSVPTSIEVKYYSGTNPPATTTNKHFNSYMDVQAFPSTGLNYSMRHYYKPEALRNCTDESILVLAKREAPGPWIPYSTSTVIDTIRKTMTVDMLGNFSQFTGTDLTNPLPVVLLNLHVEASDKQVRIVWSSASETQLSHFEVEELNNEIWNVTGAVKAIGNSKITRKYEFLHPEPQRNFTQYFRLRLVDNDGSFSYSPVVVLQSKSTSESLLYPNPASNYVNLPEHTQLITFTDISGRIFPVMQMGNQLSLTGLAPGLYLVRGLQNGLPFSARLMIQ